MIGGVIIVGGLWEGLKDRRWWEEELSLGSRVGVWLMGGEVISVG